MRCTRALQTRMPKAIVRRALFAAYSDLVQRNTNSGNSFQPSAPQSAMIPLVVKTDTVNLRWQSSPLVGGYDVTLRLLDGNFKTYSVLLPKDMGLEKSQPWPYHSTPSSSENSE